MGDGKMTYKMVHSHVVRPILTCSASSVISLTTVANCDRKVDNRKDTMPHHQQSYYLIQQPLRLVAVV